LRRAAWLLLVAAVAAACTTSPPTPDPTGTATPRAPTTSPEEPARNSRVAVVVSPSPEWEATTAEAGVRILARRLGDDAEIRVVVADDPTFVADIVGYFAAEDYGLVCALGPQAADAVRRIAATAPNTQFCAAPAVPDRMPGNALAIDVRAEEAAFLAGVAAATIAPGAPVGIVPSVAAHARGRQEQAVREALRHLGVTGGVIVGGAVGTEADADAQAAALYSLGIGTVLALAGDADPGVVTAAAAAAAADETPTASPAPTATETPAPAAPPRTVAGSPALVADDESEPVILVIEWHLEEAIAVAVQRFLNGWDTTPVSLGLVDGVLVVEVPSTPYADQVRPAVTTARDEIVAGTLSVLPQ
jgi:basic membrane lipoprotein Med (substrate-binding protein (PBP1-ABC) superfamily)